MADGARLSDMELERILRDVGRSYPYPPTPNVSLAVRARISAKPGRVRRPAGGWRDPWRLALAAALLLIALGAGLLANPTTRDAIAHFFHVRGVVVNRVPSPLPSLSPITPVYLGHRMTFGQAQSSVSFTIAVPPQLGEPDAVYVDQAVAGGEVSLAYKPRPGVPLVKQTGLGVLVTEFRGGLNPSLVVKQADPSTKLEETSVNGDPAWWIEGAPHMIVIQIGGIDQPETLRMASNTLVWEHAGVTYRIESGLSKADAMALAAGLP
jgi:hypothetical protein